VAASAESILRFGAFEADLPARELRKRGLRLKLQEQPFQVLVMLLERPGEIVTREQLRQKLWPAETFVGFDHGLNSAVNRLREVLNDSADSPRFVETLPRRGYRFVGSVTVASTKPSGVAKEQVLPTTMPDTKSGDDARTSYSGRSSLQKRALAGALVLLALGGIGWFTWRHTQVRRDLHAAGAIRSLAVLPLDNLSGDAEQDYFADGMTAQLITDLAKISSLRVVCRTSVIGYKGTQKPPAQIAKELGVDALVEGEVVRSGDQVRVTAQLIEATTDRHLWAETYRRDMRDVLDLQGEVAQSIAKVVQAKLTPEQHAGLATRRPVNPEAYEAYLKGQYFWNKRTLAGLGKSVEYFKQSIAKDKDNPLAYAGLADSYDLLQETEAVPTDDFHTKTKAVANRALELDSRLGEAHVTLARMMYFDRDWRGAEREFQRAIELSPGYATAHQRYSLLLMGMGRMEESLEEIQKARSLDPLSIVINASAGWRLVWAQRYEQAMSQLQKTLEMDPNFSETHLYLGWLYEAKGEMEKAISEFQKTTFTEAPHRGLASLGYVYAITGEKEKARRALAQLQDFSNGVQKFAYEMAIIHAGLGNRNQALQLLRQASDQREWVTSCMSVDPELASLRSDARFRGLLRQIGLTQ